MEMRDALSLPTQLLLFGRQPENEPRKVWECNLVDTTIVV